MLQYSVIAPLFNEEDNFSELYQRLRNTMEGIEGSYEIIFIDDGSRDRTFDLISQAARNDLGVVCVKLSRNFGQDNAILAGLQCSRGEEIVILDGDLQDPPEFIPELIKEKSKGYSVVYAIKANRKEGFIKKALTAIFYRMMLFLSKVEIPANAGTYSIFTRAVASQIVSLRENNKFVAGLRSYVGFKQSGITYNREKRGRGKAKSLFELLRMGLNAIFSFSILPLRITILVSLVIGACTPGILFFSAFQDASSFASNFDMNQVIAACILILILLLLLSLAIISEYVGRLHEQVKRRPDFIIESIIRDGKLIDDFKELRAEENALWGA